ncbi:MAG: hypothetical protein K6F56_06910, partial [Oscillospiraceae bacterium]|nr:hypothetical protein [Oscillospiraceae bacterium]
RADPEKIWVLIKALFRRCTLCTSRKSDEIRAQIFQEMPKADCAVLPLCQSYHKRRAFASFSQTGRRGFVIIDHEFRQRPALSKSL